MALLRVPADQEEAEVTMPKCNFKGCGEDATSRVKLAVGPKELPAELLVCEAHLFQITDHGFKLTAKLNEAGEVEIWRPSW